MNNIYGIRKILCFIVLAIFLVEPAFDCGPREKQAYMYNDCFQYYYKYVLLGGQITNNYSALVVDRFIVITGVTQEAEDREILIIPKEIEGVKVRRISSLQALTEAGNVWPNTTTKKIFIEAELDYVYDNAFYHYCNGVFFYMSTNDVSSFVYRFKVQTYFPAVTIENDYKEFIENNKNYYGSEEKAKERADMFLERNRHILYGGQRDYCYANTTYMYNYENSPNLGCYWIDNYDYGSLITYIPDNPTREGYVFLGWYKESECINQWDFEVDKIPEVDYLGSGSKNFQETRLYAKWGELNEE